MSPRIASLCVALLAVATPARAQFGNLLNRAQQQAEDAALNRRGEDEQCNAERCDPWRHEFPLKELRF